jgi:hypothetical protein
MADKDPEVKLWDLVERNHKDLDKSVAAVMRVKGPLLRHVVVLGMAAYISSRRASTKRALKRAPLEQAPAQVNTARAKAVVQVMDAILTGWTLSDGTALGKATKPMLLAEAAKARKRAVGNIADAEFYEGLADKLKGNRTAVEDLDITEVYSIRDKAMVHLEDEEG